MNNQNSQTKFFRKINKNRFFQLHVQDVSSSESRRKRSAFNKQTFLH